MRKENECQSFFLNKLKKLQPKLKKKNMKKLAFTLLACLTALLSNTLDGAVAPLGESGREITAVMHAIFDPQFSNLFLPNDTILNIVRKSPPEMNLPYEIKYQIQTGSVRLLEDDRIDHNYHEMKSYDVTLRIEPNPAIGPHIVKVTKITRE